ncbi:hypothetical protein K7432_003469 [Basidiobolus ranarum]|uniref:Uncharacterized protein n=1 Tax=Basidiobolus ranarum TaxID=34480 RepID=A0ABR2WZY8_9FUNG
MKQLPQKPYKEYCSPIYETTCSTARRKGSRVKRLSKSGLCGLKSEKANTSISLSEQAVELLRKEAFRELQRQIQCYNEQLVTRMKFVESLPFDEQQTWLEAFVQHDRHRDPDEDIEFLIDAMNDSATTKDYSPIIEWQQNTVYMHLSVHCL